MILPASSIRAAIAANTAAMTLLTGGVHINVAPQDEKRPRVILTKATDVTDRLISGAEYWGRATFAVLAVAANAKNAHAIADALKVAIAGAVGTAIDGYTMNTVEFGNSRDMTIYAEGEALGESAVAIDATVQYKPT